MTDIAFSEDVKVVSAMKVLRMAALTSVWTVERSRFIFQLPTLKGTSLFKPWMRLWMPLVITPAEPSSLRWTSSSDGPPTGGKSTPESPRYSSVKTSGLKTRGRLRSADAHFAVDNGEGRCACSLLSARDFVSA